MNFKETVVINKPIKKVFKYLSNFNSHKKFSEHFKDTKNLSKGKMQEGSELFTKVIFLGRKIESTNEVVTYVPQKEIKYKSVSGPVPAEVQFLLEEKGDATEVIFNYDIEPGSFFNMEEVFLKPRFESIVSNSLRNLKRILEAMAA